MNRIDRKTARRLIALRDERGALEKRLERATKQIAEQEWGIYGEWCVSLSEAGRELAALLGKSAPAARMWVSRNWARKGFRFYVNPANRRPHVLRSDLNRVVTELQS